MRNATADYHFNEMPHTTRKTPCDGSPPSPIDKLAYCLCFRSKAAKPQDDDVAMPTNRIYARPYLSSSARTATLINNDFDEAVSDTSSVYSQPTYTPHNNTSVMAYSVPPMPQIVQPTLQNDTSACPQFYIMISGFFSASKTLFSRRLFSNTLRACQPLEPQIQEMIEEGIHSQVVSLMDRKSRDSLWLSRHVGQPMNEEYRLSFCFGTQEGMGKTKSYLGSQTLLLAVEEAREIFASLETIIATQIAIFDPPKDGTRTGRQTVDVINCKPLSLTLRFNICNSSQKILITRLVSCRTPMYSLPPSDEVQALMQRIWKNIYSLITHERKTKRDSARETSTQKKLMLPYHFCVSFDVMFGDGEHSWLGGLCYGARPARFTDYTLIRLTRKVEDVFKEQLAMFEARANRGWPESDDKREKGFVTTDVLDDATESMKEEKSSKKDTFWSRLSGAFAAESAEKAPKIGAWKPKVVVINR